MARIFYPSLYIIRIIHENMAIREFIRYYFVFISCTPCIQKKVYNPPIFFTIYILHILFTTSIVLNGLKSGALAIVGIPLSYWVLYDTLKQYRFPPKHLKRAFYALLAWCIIPIFYYAVAPLDTKLLFMTGPRRTNIDFWRIRPTQKFLRNFFRSSFYLYTNMENEAFA